MEMTYVSVPSRVVYLSSDYRDAEHTILREEPTYAILCDRNYLVQVLPDTELDKDGRKSVWITDRNSKPWLRIDFATEHFGNLPYLTVTLWDHRYEQIMVSRHPTRDLPGRLLRIYVNYDGRIEFITQEEASVTYIPSKEAQNHETARDNDTSYRPGPV